MWYAFTYQRLAGVDCQELRRNMSSEEEDDELQDLEEIRDKMLSTPRSERMQVSAWEDDDDGVEPERNARG